MNKNIGYVSKNLRTLISLLLERGGYHEMARQAIDCDPIMLDLISHTAYFVVKHQFISKGNA